MKGLLFQQGRLRLARDLPEPSPPADEVVVHVRLAGVCATDLEIAKGYMGFEGVLGHEFVGTVEAPERGALHGSRVVGGINCPCGVCERCREGMPFHCPARTVLGILGRQGAFAERIALPAANLVRVPDGVPDEEAVFAEPLAAVLRMEEQNPFAPRDRVAVVGDGRLGLLAAGVGLVKGWRLALVGKHPERLDLLPGRPPFFPPGGAPASSFDIAVDCSGSPGGFAEALRLLKPQGRLVLKTTVALREGADLNRIVIDEIRVIGSRCGPMDQAVAFLAEGRFKPSVLTTARFPLSKGLDAFSAAQNPGQIKVLLDTAG